VLQRGQGGCGLVPVAAARRGPGVFFEKGVVAQQQPVREAGFLASIAPEVDEVDEAFLAAAQGCRV
ncbi:MAG TPA: hypothetical protein P5076_09715, partial [Myxococcota bacterium]|nr:hypothetical protein [Myxococcota bacterium]